MLLLLLSEWVSEKDEELLLLELLLAASPEPFPCLCL